MKVYTKNGDKGETSLWGGTKVSKASLRIETYGTIDELNSWMGLVRDYTINAPHKELIIAIQHELFTIGANLAASPGKNESKLPLLSDDLLSDVEKAIDSIQDELEPQKYFTIPGGHKEISFVHIARTVCRRAERMLVHLSESEKVDVAIITFVNRLSDYIYVLTRWMAKALPAEETFWIPKEK